MVTPIIVCLDACHCPIPQFSSALPHTYVEYENTSSDTVIERAKGAHIVITTRVPLTAATIAQCPHLKHVAIMAAGTDPVDLAACKEQGISVSSISSASSEAVAEHAIALYLAVKRRIVHLHQLTMEGIEWGLRGSLVGEYHGLPKPCSQQTLGLIGYGHLGKTVISKQSLSKAKYVSAGKRIQSIANALGMRVLIADRKETPIETLRYGRSSFSKTLEDSDVIIIGIPLNETTRNIISTNELQQMRPTAILVNVARGGVMDEAALVKALKEGWISGAATDVFSREPAKKGENMLLDLGNLNLNLIISPHVAWYASSSIQNLKDTVKANVEGFLDGKPQNLVTV